MKHAMRTAALVAATFLLSCPIWGQETEAPPLPPDGGQPVYGGILTAKAVEIPQSTSAAEEAEVAELNRRMDQLRGEFLQGRRWVLKEIKDLQAQRDKVACRAYKKRAVRRQRARLSAIDRKQNFRIDWLADDRNILYREVNAIKEALEKKGIEIPEIEATKAAKPAEPTPKLPQAKATPPVPTPGKTPTAPGKAIRVPTNWGGGVYFTQHITPVVSGEPATDEKTTDEEPATEPKGLSVHVYLDTNLDGFRDDNEMLAAGARVSVVAPDGKTWELITGKNGGWLLPATIAEGIYIFRAGEKSVTVDFPKKAEVYVPLSVYGKTLRQLQLKISAIELAAKDAEKAAKEARDAASTPRSRDPLLTIMLAFIMLASFVILLFLLLGRRAA